MDLFEYYDTVSVENSDALIEFASKSYDENILKTFDKIFFTTIQSELETLITIEEQYGSIGNKIVAHKSLGLFFEKIYTASCPKILKYNLTIQQMYLLHILAILLLRYNSHTLKYEDDKFMSDIYISNIMSSCAKHLINARRFIHRLVKTSYLTVEDKCKDIINFYIEFHNIEPHVIKNDIIYLFLRKVLVQYDPIEMGNIEQLYSSVVSRMFFFYLKARTSGKTDLEINNSVINDGVFGYSSERYHIYEEAIYLSQIQLMCDNSTIIHQISKQYNKLKSIILPNEIQRFYLLSLNKGQYITNNKKLATIKIYNSERKMSSLKNTLPIIYRILRSIHITSETPNFIKSDIDKIRNAVYETLCSRFKYMLSDETSTIVIHKITNNLVNSLTIGEFIDMLTLTTVNISTDKFIEQLQKFLEMILSDIGLEENC